MLSCLGPWLLLLLFLCPCLCSPLADKCSHLPPPLPTPLSLSAPHPPGARGQRSAVKFEQEHAAAHSLASSSLNLQEWLSARQKVAPGAGPLLSVTNFGLENMEVRALRARTTALLLPPQALLV